MLCIMIDSGGAHTTGSSTGSPGKGYCNVVFTFDTPEHVNSYNENGQFGYVRCVWSQVNRLKRLHYQLCRVMIALALNYM